ncbi:DUF4832 domain-containing protein [Piscinibacter sp. XHJ-5]|uniref:DUF4832 domain-containing protein n=1 Tax=Piscinibacter sp. XHJ-5 TaxID=3037797 RepID=UPI002452B07D|nr:DUF4832 domain-containing protein [Piscinibacter sp. XHJ-5]
MKSPQRLFYLLCTLASAAAAQVVTKVPPYVSLSFTENTASFIKNPERGLYRHLDLFEDRAGRTLLDKCVYARDRGYSVIYTQAILPQSPVLDDVVLGKVTQGFSDIRQCGAKAIVRFYYFDKDCDGTPGCVPCPKDSNDNCIDPPRQTILQHISQLKPYLAANQDVIMAVKAGFVGPWGEWHSSTLSTDADRGIILRALLDAVPSNRMVQVRTPSKRHGIFSNSPTVVASNAIGQPNGPQPYDGSAESRTGHHNDCFLSSLDDRGTYSEFGTPAYHAERAYVGFNSLFTPMGGETCNLLDTYHPTDEELQCRAIADITQMHWTYLNGGYSGSVRYKLGARDLNYDDPTSGYHIDSPAHTGVWREILRTLGYRIILPKASFTRSVRRGGTLQFTADVKNVGVAPLINPRPVYLVLHNQLNTYKIQLKVDPRRWIPGVTHLSMSVPVPSFAVPGRYTVSLWLPDASAELRDRPEYAVRLAHEDMLWDAVRGFNTLSLLGLEVAP